MTGAKRSSEGGEAEGRGVARSTALPAQPPASRRERQDGQKETDHGHACHEHADQLCAEASPPACRGHAHHAYTQHEHHHGQAPQDFGHAFALGIALNLGFVVLEAASGWWAGSLALLADAAHNLSDVAGLALAWAGAWALQLKPDARHTYGWQRASILAAFANAVLLFAAMGWLAWEAVQRLAQPQAVQGWTVVGVAAAGIVVNSATALLFLRGQHGDLNVRGAFLHMAADALVSLGVVIAGALYLWRGWGWLDPVMSLTVAVVIVLGSWGLLRESTRLLFDGVPERVDPLAVRAYLEQLPGVERVDDLHIWAMGTTQIALSAHLIAPGGPLGDAALHQAAADLRSRFGIQHATLQVLQQPIESLRASHG